VGDTWNETDADPGEEPLTTNLSLWEMLGGEIPALPPGQEIVPIATPQGSERTLEWIASLAAHFVMSLGIPPAYFLDEKLTGPNQRSVNKKAQRRFRQSQKMVARMNEWVWVRVMGDAIDRGELPATLGWDRVEHVFPAELSIDDGSDQANDRENALKGLSSLKAYHKRRAGDWQREKRQMFEEDEQTISEAKAIATRHGVPVEIILSRHGYAAAQVQSNPKPDGGNRPKEDEKETPKNDSDDEP
jgi:hypothetical protein